MVKESPFLFLTCELPPPPLFRDEHYNNIIPQVSLFTILNKFNGETEKEYRTYKDNIIRKFELTKLPPYIILYIQRFNKNTFFVEKNPTIVNFPVKGIDFGDYLSPEAKEKYKDDNTCYDLVANVVHEGLPTSGIYKVHVLHKGMFLTAKLRGSSSYFVVDVSRQTFKFNFSHLGASSQGLVLVFLCISF